MDKLLTKQQIPVLVARLVEFQEEFSALSTTDGQFVIQDTKEAIKLFVEAVKNRGNLKKESSILKLVSGNKKVMIEALNGQATIDKAKKTFKSFIDSDFKELGFDKPGPATAETCLDVYEIAEGATFKQMFTSLNPDLDKLVMTQNQIVRFCKKHPAWLSREAHGVLFLVKKDYNAPATNDNIFMVNVNVDSNGLGAGVYPLEDDVIWDAEFRYSLVVPQFIPLAS